MFEDDEQLEEVWKKQHALAEFTANTNFKSYSELKTRLDNVLAGTTVVGNVTDEPEVTVTVDTKEEPAPTVAVSADNDEDTMSYFEKLANED